MKIFSWILAGCALLVAGYYVWSYTGKDYSKLPSAAVSIVISNNGANRGRGNLLTIQPFLTASDYCDQQHFYNALHVYFRRAQQAGLLQQKTVVVLPENIGTWLAFANEKTRVYKSDSMRQAVATIVNASIFSFIKNLMPTPAGDKVKHAFVYMKAAQMIRIYTAVFSSLAKDFHVTIAAGSIILPQPSLDAKSRIRFNKGRLYYSAFIFNPEGKIQARPVLKVLPGYDSGKTVAADSNLYVVAQTPAGNIALTADENFSTDSPYAPAAMWKALAVIFLTGDDKIWNATWKGQNGFVIPMDAIKRMEDTSFLNRNAARGSISSQLRPSAPGGKTAIRDGFTGNLWEVSYQNKLTVERTADVLLDRNPVKHEGIIINTWIH